MKKSILFTLMLSTFVVGTIELIIAGILELIARDLHVSASSVGQLITIYAITAAIGAPLILTMITKVERKLVLLVSLFIFILCNIVSAMSTSYLVLALSRVVVALSAAIFEIVALSIAAQLAPIEIRGKMLGFVYMGFSAANVLGVPLGTMIGAHFGWRATFIAIAVLSAICFLGIVINIPKIKSERAEASIHEHLHVLKNPVILGVLIIGMLLLAGHYVVYAYISPLLTLAGYTTETVSLFLFIFGVAGTIGTSFGGILTDRIGVKPTFQLEIACFSASLFLLPFVLHSFSLLILVTIIWSSMIWATSPTTQYYLIKAAPRSPDLALSLNMSALNIGVALGSAVGGAALLKFPVVYETWIGGLFGVVSFLLFMIVIKVKVHLEATES